MRFRFSAVLAAALTLLGLPALAAGEVSVVPANGGARLVVHGKLITLFRSPNGTLSPQQRAEKAAERLRALMSEGANSQDVSVRERPDGSCGVYLRGGLLMIATEEEGQARGKSARATADLWAGNLKEALGAAKPGTTPEKAEAAKSQPKPGPRTVAAAKPASKPAAKPAPQPSRSDARLGVRITDLAVPVGETRTVAVRGNASGPVALRVEGSAATARVVDGGNLIELKGISPGKCKVRVGRGSLETAFEVWVKKYAGVVAETPTALVTGALTPAAYVRKVAVERALEGVQREPGARVKITGPVEGIRALARGETLTARFPILIEGGNYLPHKTYATVKVENLELQPEPASLLLYSNDPESVREYGALYEGLLEADGPARLMYHHQNRMGQPFTFEVHLLNPNRTPVDVQIIEGAAGPILDTIQVGHRAAERYMAASAKDVGYVLTIPPRQSRTIYQVKVDNMLTVSGLYGLRILDGGALITHVSASPEPSTPEVSDDLVLAARSELDTYPSPEKSESYTYRVGERWTFIPLGRKAISAKTPNKKLFGNYGVLYNLSVDLENPTDEEKTVTVRLAAEAGWTRGVFMIDGKIIEAPQIAPPADAVLWSVKLAPQERRQVKIQGIPIGGSAYPVSLVVRS